MEREPMHRFVYRLCRAEWVYREKAARLTRNPPGVQTETEEGGEKPHPPWSRALG